MRTRFLMCLGTVLCSFAAWCLGASSAQAAKPQEVESWILEKVTVGEEADLKKHFGVEQVVSAGFLESLVVGSEKKVKIHRHGIRIKHAVFEQPIDLENAEISHELRLTDSHFKEAVNFENAILRRNLILDGSRFKKAEFSGLKTDGSLSIDNAVFTEGVHFEAVKIAGSMGAEGAKFNCEFTSGTCRPNRESFKSWDEGTSFNSMKVTGHVTLRNAEFWGPIEFTKAEVNGNFQAGGSKFEDGNWPVEFNSMKVDGTVLLNQVTFKGPIGFRVMDIGKNLELKGAIFQSKKSLKEVRDFKLSPVFYNVDFRGTKVGGALVIIGADFSAIPNNTIRLEALSYQSVYVAREGIAEAWPLLKELCERSEFSADVYVKLEEYFLKQGYIEEANKVYLTRKSLERRRLDWPSWVLSEMANIFVGHGRYPERIFLWIVPFIVAGFVIFHDKNGMEQQKPDERAGEYEPFWYSLDLFLPLTRLQASDIWIPKKSRKLAWVYMRIHHLMGWILVPIFLAALTGLVK